MAKKLKRNVVLDHLEELRWLLVRSTIAILILATVTFFVSDYIFDVIILVQPMLISLPIGFVTCLINWVSPEYLCDRPCIIIQHQYGSN
jgi:Sec-independent protein secretion pathway component TatC